MSPALGKNKSDDQERLERRIRVWTMRIENGFSQVQIAEIENVNQATISRDLRFMANKVMDTFVEEARAEVARQIHRLEYIIQEMMTQYELSKRPSREVREHKRIMQFPTSDESSEAAEALFKARLAGTDDSEIPEIVLYRDVTTDVKERDPNLGNLKMVMDAMRDLRKIYQIEKGAEKKTSWEDELLEAGIDPAELYDDVVESAFKVFTDDITFDSVEALPESTEEARK